MFEIDKDTALVVLWGATVLLMGWTWFPAIMAALGATRYQLRAVEKTESEFPAATGEPDYEFWAAQVRSLGYEGSAVGSGRIQYLEAEWRVEGPFRVFYSPQKYAYAL